MEKMNTDSDNSYDKIAKIEMPIEPSKCLLTKDKHFNEDFAKEDDIQSNTRGLKDSNKKSKKGDFCVFISSILCCTLCLNSCRNDKNKDNEDKKAESLTEICECFDCFFDICENGTDCDCGDCYCGDCFCIAF